MAISSHIITPNVNPDANPLNSIPNHLIFHINAKNTRAVPAIQLIIIPNMIALEEIGVMVYCVMMA